MPKRTLTKFEIARRAGMHHNLLSYYLGRGKRGEHVPIELVARIVLAADGQIRPDDLRKDWRKAAKEVASIL